MNFSCRISNKNYFFKSLKELLAKATPLRSGDRLAGLIAEDATERVAAQMVLADLPLTYFLEELVIPYESDEVSRLIIDTHDKEAFKEISHLTVGEFRNWLLLYSTNSEVLKRVSKGITPEMAASVSKIMRIQDMALVSGKCENVAKFRNTIGLAGRFSTRLQPNHPSDDLKGIAATTFDGLMYGSGDAVIGINPATDHVNRVMSIHYLLNDIREKLEIPTQTCVLSHITTTIEAINRGAPVDLVFQSIAGTEQANKSFGVSLSILKEGYDAALSLQRYTIGNNVMYFETGQGSALSANAHDGVDQQTLEVRAYAVARHFNPLLVNTVVGFIGPEYLFNGKQIIRAGIEDLFCGKLLGLPMGCDVCYTNHAEADQDDMDVLLTLLAASGCVYIMGVPGADDIMLNYQSTSFHDAWYIRQLLKLPPAPEFEQWLVHKGISNNRFELNAPLAMMGRFSRFLE